MGPFDWADSSTDDWAPGAVGALITFHGDATQSGPPPPAAPVGPGGSGGPDGVQRRLKAIQGSFLNHQCRWRFHSPGGDLPTDVTGEEEHPYGIIRRAARLLTSAKPEPPTT